MTYHYQNAASGSTDRRLYDFERWLHNSSHAAKLLDSHATVPEALFAYKLAIRRERERVETLMPHVHEAFKRRLVQLTTSGHIPTVFLNRLEASPVATHVSLGIYDSAFEEDSSAIYWPNQHLIRFRPWAAKKQLAQCYVHESFHSLSGSTNYLVDKTIVATRTGFGTDAAADKEPQDSAQAKHRALNEGVTEYLTNIVAYGLPGQISPEERSEKDTGHYNNERRIVEIIAGRVGLKTLLEAFAEDYQPGKPNTFRHNRAFIKAVRLAYGPGFLGKLDKLDREEGAEAALEFVRRADSRAEERSREQPKIQNRRAKAERALTLLGLKKTAL